jgi:hypothetical protein
MPLYSWTLNYVGDTEYFVIELRHDVSIVHFISQSLDRIIEKLIKNLP